MKGSVARYGEGGRTELWRIFSWCVGDSHADRICCMLDWYCRIFRISPHRFRRWPTGNTVLR
jgi:hypothetical protein